MGVQTALISQGGYNWVPVLQSVSLTNQSMPSNSYISSINHCKTRCCLPPAREICCCVGLQHDRPDLITQVTCASQA